MYRQSEKNLLNSNMFSTCPHNINMANFGPLMPEIVSGVWSTPANFNGFRVLVSLLHRHRSSEANQTLHDFWPSPVPYNIYTFLGALASWWNFATCKIHFASSFALFYIGSVTARHSRVVGVSQTLRRWAEGATYIRQGGHHIGHWPTF